MVSPNINNSNINNRRVSIISLSTTGVLLLHLPVYAGPQSLLDPYATIQPPAGQTESTSLGDRTSAKKPGLAGKLKTARSSTKNTTGQPGNTTNNAATNPGFLSGIKEIQHGCMTSFKATGHGIVNGSKSAGAKIASLAAKTPHAKKPKPGSPKTAAVGNTQATGINSAFTPNGTVSELPGKPLGPVVNTLPSPAKKAKPLAVGTGKKNIVARTFDKFNVFAKYKKAKKTNANIATANANAVAR